MQLVVSFSVRAIAEPQAFEKYMKERVSKQIEEKRANRITFSKNLPKVNAELAKELLQQPKNKRRIAEIAEQVRVVNAHVVPRWLALTCLLISIDRV